jgi:polyphosphate glucokinase
VATRATKTAGTTKKAASARKASPPATGQAGTAKAPGSKTTSPAKATTKRTAKSGAVKSALVNTLAVDVGGTGLKASVLDLSGQMEHVRVRIPTPYPLSPDTLVATLKQMATQLPPFDRVSVGFPGMVREGKVLTAPHFVSPDGPGGKVSPELLRAWTGSDLQSSLTEAWGKPCRVVNDADMQGAAVVKGEGLELVVTLGTGVGTGLFWHGALAPHLELAHHPFRRDQTYNEQLGDAARKRIGSKKWNRRVSLMIETLHGLLFYDHLYIGGGNSARVKGELGPKITLVSNDAGILGGIKLWDREHL